ncbi:MAG: chromate resistance protein ChrB domain-containing protein [Candidatus Odinarchaeota archaeon]
MLWVTRDYVHIDRVASPWLIRRFVDKQAQFIFLPRDEIVDFADKTGAIPFDTAGLGVELDHHTCNDEKHCTFDAIMEKYKLESDEALQNVRKLVRAADTGEIEEEPLAWALEVIAVGTPIIVDSDHEALENEFPVYDAIYAYFQQQIIREKFKDEIDKLRSRGERLAFIKKKLGN